MRERERERERETKRVMKLYLMILPSTNDRQYRKSSVDQNANYCLKQKASRSTTHFH